MLALFMVATPVSAKCDATHGNADCRDDDPAVNATPELDSLVLFGTGILGAGGYALTRFRARRRHDEVVDNSTTT
jgi:hypothetical protein